LFLTLFCGGFAKKARSHIHGHKYQIVARSSDYTSDDPSVITMANQTNPLRRDTIQIESGGSATLRCVSLPSFSPPFFRIRIKRQRPTES
jgi:iron transport multicopper oxidase